MAMFCVTVFVPLLLFVFGKNVGCVPIQGALDADWLNKTLTNTTANQETLQGLSHSDEAVIEGDLLQSSDRNAVWSTWPAVNGIVSIPYVISESVADRTNDLLLAMEMVSEHTCVTFHDRQQEQNYLAFQSSEGCASYVGLMGGEQNVFVGPRCTVGNICHEILHALGFLHEHTREDRDEYVTVIENNAMKNEKNNFKIQMGNTLNIPYDIGSILHYGSYFFSSNGKPTIIPKKQNKQMGQRSHMSVLDIKRVRELYHCDG